MVTNHLNQPQKMRLYKLLMELRLGTKLQKNLKETLDEAMKQLEDQVNQDDQISNSSHS